MMWGLLFSYVTLKCAEAFSLSVDCIMETR